jgi:hypothetical protein
MLGVGKKAAAFSGFPLLAEVPVLSPGSSKLLTLFGDEFLSLARVDLF